MHATPTLRVVAPFVIGALVLSACGSKKEEGGDGGGGKTLVIGVVAPLSGDLTAVGNGIKNGVDLAIKQANTAKTVPGYTLQLDAQDDAAKADTGATVATKFVSENDLVGVVGPLNSSVAKSVAPILSGADLAEISPSNSGVDLTGREALATPGTTQTRPYKSYFRVVATDDIQGPFGAQYVVNTLKKKTIAIVNDKKAYGQGLSSAFAAEAKKDGATVLPTQTVNPGDKDFSAVITKIKPSKPDFLFYGGEYPEAGLLTKQMKSAGLDIPLMGGDGIDADGFITTAGAAANGDYATSLGAPTDSLDSAKTFLSDYKSAGYSDPADPYGGYAYDSANAIIKAIASAVSAGKKPSDLQGFRDAVTAGVQAANFAGVTGQISFDMFGDTNAKILTVYSVMDGKFVAAKTDSFK